MVYMICIPEEETKAQGDEEIIRGQKASGGQGQDLNPGLKRCLLWKRKSEPLSSVSR